MVSADTICAAPHWQTSNCSIANGKYGNSRRNNILRDDAVDDFSRGPRHIPAMGDFIDHATDMETDRRQTAPSPTNENTNLRFWSEMETDAVGTRYGKRLRELTNGVCCKCA